MLRVYSFSQRRGRSFTYLLDSLWLMDIFSWYQRILIISSPVCWRRHQLLWDFPHKLRLAFEMIIQIFQDLSVRLLRLFILIMLFWLNLRNVHLSFNKDILSIRSLQFNSALGKLVIHLDLLPYWCYQIIRNFHGFFLRSRLLF